MGRVDGKVAIVTGAARGMGAAFARRLAAEGARVVLTDLREEEGTATAAALGDNARFVRHDVTSADDWRAVVAQAEAAFGPVSVLVNNAGIASYAVSDTLDEASYRRVIDVNQVSVFLGMTAVLPSMRRAGGGSMINISSVLGIVSTPYTLAYTAAKFAVRGMSKTAALEFAPYNIRVNSVHPGYIQTPMVDESGSAIDALIAHVKAVTPAARLGEPDEVASVVLLLASDESRFTTGAEFVVDGGLTCQ